MPFDCGLSTGVVSGNRPMSCKPAGVGRRVARAIVGQPFDRGRQPVDLSEAMFDGAHHQIADVLALDSSGCRDMTHGLAIAAIERESDTNLLGVVTGDLESVGTPAAV